MSPTSLRPAIWATAGNGGIWHIAEGEAAWTERDTGLGGLYVASLAVDPHAPTRLFAAISNAGVYRSTDGGLTWAPDVERDPDSYINALAVDPQLADTVYAATQSGVYRSADAGASWSPLTGGLALPAVDSLAFDADGRTLYAGTQAIGVAARTRALPAPAGSAPRLVASPRSRHAAPGPQAHRDERDLGRRARSGAHARLAALHVREARARRSARADRRTPSRPPTSGASFAYT